MGKEETLEVVENEGICGEPKDVDVVEHVVEDVSSSELGGIITDWVNRMDEICVSENLLDIESIEACMMMIRDSTTLLVKRGMELETQLSEAERKNLRLEEQTRRMSFGSSSPKRNSVKVVAAANIAQSITVGPSMLRGSKVLPTLIREEFPPLPPLPQRPPRNVTTRSGGDRMAFVVQAPPPCDYWGF